jgi:iron complex transport system ATP-binding protein
VGPVKRPGLRAGTVAGVRAFDLQGVSLWRWHAASASRVPILEGVEWTARAGERWALLGPNGAGKTTLLTLLGAVEFPSRGTVELLGRRMGRTDVFRLRKEIGFVDARLGHRFPPPFTVAQVVETGATGTVGWFPARIGAAARSSAAGLLDLLDCARIAGRRFVDCSQGERKRTLIARALVSRPRLLLLDEPGAGLDLAGRETLLAALGRLADEEPELTVVVTTHHLEELPASTTHAVLLRAGGVVAAGPAARTLTSELLSACFGLPVQVNRANGRWSATAS